MKLNELEIGENFKVDTQYGTSYLTVSAHKENNKIRVYNHNTGNNLILSGDKEVKAIDKIPEQIKNKNQEAN